MKIVAAIVASLALQVFAQGFPDNRPIRIIVPFAPGGNVDIIARIVQPGLSQELGQPVVVENRPGAGGTIGAELVARSAPDGHTLLMGSNSTFSVAPSLYSRIPYHPLKDLAPVVSLASSPFVLVTGAASPAKTAADLVATARSSPGKLTMSSAGTGSSNHLVGELFQRESGTRFVHVPYKGSGDALIALMGGQVDLHFDQLTSAVGHVKSGKLRALMVTSRQRVPMLPEVPTASEAGYASFEATNVTGLMAPGGTPRSIILRINAAANAVIKRPDVVQKFADIGATPTGGTPEDFAAYIEKDLAKWTRIVKEANVKVD
jgi:tripartite-type tricarboxylate transporter receptor subunit TctC